MCCLGLSAKSNVCDVQYSVLFSLCLECVVIVGHVWCCVYVYVCVCLCLCVCMCICLCVYMCGIVCDVQYGDLFIYIFSILWWFCV